MKRLLLILWAAIVSAPTPASTQEPALFDYLHYSGADPLPEPGPGEYRNPILQGFYPDPSITRAGDDYYLVTSTFAWFPGIPVFHSRDLVNWTQIGNAIDRSDQLDFKALGLSRGVFAPAIEHRAGTFYILNTCVDCGGNFIITAKDPRGPWSDPAWLPEIEGGIDPSLFFDADGSAWILNNGPPVGEPRYDGHRAIWIQRFDPKALKLVGPRTMLVDGGVDPATKPIWIEGPHITRKDGWYYLTAAEGGTAEGHSQVVLRSRNVTGPYAPFAGNPILTQRDLPRDRAAPITSAGHADMVQTASGEWWATFLAVRPYAGDYYNTGRETFLMPVSWQEGWPRMTAPGQVIPWTARRPNLPLQPRPAVPMSGPFAVRDEFTAPSLPPYWMMMRNPRSQWWSIADGQLRLQPRAVALGDNGNPSLLARRQQHITASAATAVRFKPGSDRAEAGLVALQSDDFWYFLSVGQDGGQPVVRLRRRAGASEPVTGQVIKQAALPVPPGAPVHLRIDARGGAYDFRWSADNKSWSTLLDNGDGTILSTKTAGGFVGAVFGLHAYDSNAAPDQAISAALSGAPAKAAVRVNQLGLLPDGRKVAIVPDSSKRPLDWRLVDGGGHVLASGKTRLFGADRWSGEHVHQIDFSDFAATGSGYRVTVGARSSHPFAVSHDIYQRLPYDALAYFYHNRAGTPIDARLVGERWARPAAHVGERATCVRGADPNGNIWPGCSHTLDVTGGWYDAGDHGKYVVNGGISLWTLLNLHERNAVRGSSLFADGTAAVPERGNGVPDLLDEARWEMEFLLKMQVPDGTRLSVPVGVKRNVRGLRFTEIDASGMAHHKVADEKWTALPMRPDRDPERRQLFPPSTAATLNLAATAAQCARVWRTIDPAFAAGCLGAARRAWSAALRNPEVYAIATHTGSGGYGDDDVSDEFYWAAAELLATTGEPQFRSAVDRSPHFRAPIDEAAGWPSVAPLGSITLALNPAADSPRLQRAIAAAADRFLAERKRVGYAIPFATDWEWGSTSSLLNRAVLLALAHDFTGNPRYRNGVIDLMDFVLGRNPLDRSFVSGFGARPMENPHHRFWARSADPAYPPPPPGALSGGPNQNTGQDEVAKALKGCAPQTCWVDHIGSFSMNEVAINWNAPLVWVSAWLAQTPAPVAPGERG